MGSERRGRAVHGRLEVNGSGEEPTDRPRQKKLKSFEIPKRLVFEAWEKVRANSGAPGVDAVSIDDFAADEVDNLYKLWNRMSSGSYFPGRCEPLRYRKIMGPGSGFSVCRMWQTGWLRPRQRCCWKRSLSRSSTRQLPIPAWAKRPTTRWAVARKRCWNKDWVLDLDVRAFFDSVRHDLLMKAVAHHTDERWVLLYIERWLKAPMTMRDGTTAPRERGTPQGSPISPLLANLFMHYAFDKWMDRENSRCPFERYADDVVIHCDTEQQAQQLCADLAARLGSLGLELHPDKTKIVYCKDTKRRDEAEHTSFDFLAYTFRGRLARGRRGFFVSFSPAMSPKAKKAIGKQIRDWHLNRRSATDLAGLAGAINAQVRGWFNYYGAFYRSSCMPSQRASTNISSDGRCRSSNDCEANPPKRGDGSTLPVSASHNSSLTGTSLLQPHAGLWEPYDGRLSRTVLREREGEVPSRHSPGEIRGEIQREWRRWGAAGCQQNHSDQRVCSSSYPPWVRPMWSNMASAWGNGRIVKSRYDCRYAMAPGHVWCMADQVGGDFGPAYDASARRSIVRPAAGAVLGLSANRALRGLSFPRWVATCLCGLV